MSHFFAVQLQRRSALDSALADVKPRPEMKDNVDKMGGQCLLLIQCWRKEANR
ncbi:hypothetical protein QWZ16_08300 [Vibrio ostreicida]|uniref:Uncharacterized protein n=1 Tax=Vibrio ostreicida TaxID=526588 RepID=A0ABT8BSG2_9VIBR|nr:hypothetical protein [Vibrio ostreicida]MDN3609702.1 hypothetical protein [Vibrio ostreicida]